jgi:hypothetical protein
MYLYSERLLIQILSISLGPLIGLMVVAFFRSVWLGLTIGLLSAVLIYLQPVFSDIFLKNTAKALKLEEIILAEGKVTYFSRNEEMQGMLFLTRKYLAFVFNNKIDFIFPVENIIKVKEKIDEYDREVSFEFASLLDRRSANLEQILNVVSNLACLSSGLFLLSVGQSIFQNEFVFRVTYPSLWIKKIASLKSRAL